MQMKSFTGSEAGSKGTMKGKESTREEEKRNKARAGQRLQHEVFLGEQQRWLEDKSWPQR